MKVVLLALVLSFAVVAYSQGDCTTRLAGLSNCVTAFANAAVSELFIIFKTIDTKGELTNVCQWEGDQRLKLIVVCLHGSKMETTLYP